MNRAEARYASLPTTEAELLARYSSLIDRSARRLAARAGLPQGAEELWSAGALGLLEAARRYEPSREIRFETFAEHRIRGAMLDELRKLDHLPRRLRAQLGAVEKARVKLNAELGRPPRLEELALRAGLTVETLGELELLRQPVLPLDEASLVPSLEEGAEASFDRKAASARLTTAISALDGRLQQVLSLYYVEELTFREVAKLLSVSEARVCQLHAAAVERLRALLAER